MLDFAAAANRIKTLAKQRNITITTLLTECCNGNTDLLSTMKKGNVPRVDNIAAIAERLSVSVDYILGRTDEYRIGDVANSCIAQGAGATAGAVHSFNGESTTSVEAAELVRIYSALDVRARHRLMTEAFNLENEAAKNAKGDG
jgi:transcriptional regulator with XRE-family HTH domain